MKDSNELTLIEALNKLKSGELTSVDLVKDCYDRIESVDEHIKAFIVLRKKEAIEEAEKADKKIEEYGEDAFTQHPLLGIPFACKDNFSTEGIQTTASSSILKGYIPPFESTVTRRFCSWLFH